MQTVAGVMFACVAALLFNGAVVLQAREARALPPEQGLRLSLLVSLARRRAWLVGIVLQLLAFGLQTAALLLAPLTVIQPADAAGLLLLVYLGARHLGEGVGRAETLAVGSIVVGIVGLTLAAPHRQVTGADPADTVHVWLPLATLAVAATTPYLVRNWRDASSWIVILGAGFAFALSAFCAKLLADAITRHAWGTLLLVAATAAFGGAIGTLSEQSALQRRQATQVAPLVFVIELLIPVGLAVTVVGEDWHRSPTWIGICLALVTAGTVALARTPTIAQLITSGQFDTPATVQAPPPLDNPQQRCECASPRPSDRQAARQSLK
jgi:drug/metabolite transporter (DMT)-like permease